MASVQSDSILKGTTERKASALIALDENKRLNRTKEHSAMLLSIVNFVNLHFKLMISIFFYFSGRIVFFLYDFGSIISLQTNLTTVWKRHFIFILNGTLM